MAEEYEADDGNEARERSQWRRMWRRFRRHTLGQLGGIIVLVIAVIIFMANFIAPYNYTTQNRDFSNAPPTKIHFADEDGLTRPYVYGTKKEYNEYYEKVYVEDKSEKYPIKFFVRGEKYSFWGLFESRIHLF
ncbi:ABC transporter permease, partial [Candidatus Bipolaricaulota bacterium]|nr:ABC transporter permease [Candidatus Bipolaricaulota bacterium]